MSSGLKWQNLVVIASIKIAFCTSHWTCTGKNYKGRHLANSKNKNKSTDEKMRIK